MVPCLPVTKVTVCNPACQCQGSLVVGYSLGALLYVYVSKVTLLITVRVTLVVVY